MGVEHLAVREGRTKRLPADPNPVTNKTSVKVHLTHTHTHTHTQKEKQNYTINTCTNTHKHTVASTIQIVYNKKLRGGFHS